MTRADRRRLALALAAAAAVVVLSPWIGEARSWLRREIPAQFSLALNAALAAAGVGVLAAALWQIRTRRAARLAALAASVVVMAGFALATASPSAAQNAVERFHYLEYGALTWLFYRVWRDRGDLSTVILPVLAGLLVGTADEAWQWFVPERVGEWRDIFINLGAIASGLLFSVAVAPPTLAWRLAGASRRRVAVASALVILALGAFLQCVHLGHLVTDPDLGAFRSRYTGAELRALAADRAARWRSDPPPMTLRRFSREDQYMAEALWHVRARNDAWATEVTRAWYENQLLERYFAPVLDVRSYLAPDGVRWPPGQRADAQARAGKPDPAGFVSQADPPGFVLVWPPAALWATTAALAAGLVFLGLGGRARRDAKPLAPAP